MKFNDQYFAGAQKVIMGVLASARAQLMSEHGQIGFSLKADASVVTELDQELEHKLRDALQTFDSGVGFWGEEHGRRGNEESFWLVDPIDGTESFIRGLAGCRNMATFVSGGKAQYALIYRFTTDDLFVAMRGRGTTLNGHKTSVNKTDLKRSWLEFSVNLLQDDGYKIFQSLRPQIGGITVRHDFLEVVEGSLEGLIVYKSGGDVWDYAPRALLIEEAGGRVANVGKNTYDLFNRDFIATNAVIFEDVQKLLSEAIKTV